MVENGIALIGATIVESDAKQVGMVRELDGQMKTELAAKE
jgi:hypothetical protein